MNLFTIGFTQISARDFFETLRKAKVTRLIDTRLHRDGQLSGFAKARDLAYFSKELCAIEYVAVPDLAPTPEMLNSYKSKKISWGEYEHLYANLLTQRKPECTLSSDAFDHACLLCSERSPHHCHRRLAAEYLRSTLFKDFPIEITHL